MVRTALSRFGWDPLWSFPSTVWRSKLKKVAEMLQGQFGPPTAARNLSQAVWSSHQRKDDRLGPIIRYLTSNASTPMSEFPKELRARAQSYRVVGGLLYYRSIREIGTYDMDEGWVLAVPTSLRDKVIRECHEDNVIGHGGIAKTVLAIRQRYHFKGVRKLVAAFINKCIQCRRAKSHVDQWGSPLVPMMSYVPFRAIAIDLYSPGEVTPDGFKYVPVSYTHLTLPTICSV